MPHGVTGCRPPEVLPSPPPSGWSTGFIATPRTCGRLPSQRLRPALPIDTFSWSMIADLADRRQALDVDEPDFARRHLHRRVAAFLGHQLHGRSGRPRDLPALARLQLDVVHHRAERNVLQRQAVARQDVDARRPTSPGRRPSARADAGCSASRRRRRSRARCARVRFGSYSTVVDLARDVELVALEVDDAVVALVPAAAPPGRQLAAVVAAARSRRASRPAACTASSIVISSNVCTLWNRRPADVGL